MNGEHNKNDEEQQSKQLRLDGDYDPRTQRARRDIEAVEETPDGDYIVASTSGSEYRVSLIGEEARCECPDHEFRGARCKHIRAAAAVADDAADDDDDQPTAEAIAEETRVLLEERGEKHEWRGETHLEIPDAEQAGRDIAERHEGVEYHEATVRVPHHGRVSVPAVRVADTHVTTRPGRVRILEEGGDGA